MFHKNYFQNYITSRLIFGEAASHPEEVQAGLRKGAEAPGCTAEECHARTEFAEWDIEGTLKNLAEVLGLKLQVIPYKGGEQLKYERDDGPPLHVIRGDKGDIRIFETDPRNNGQMVKLGDTIQDGSLFIDQFIHALNYSPGTVWQTCLDRDGIVREDVSDDNNTFFEFRQGFNVHYDHLQDIWTVVEMSSEGERSVGRYHGNNKSEMDELFGEINGRTRIPEIKAAAAVRDFLISKGASIDIARGNRRTTVYDFGAFDIQEERSGEGGVYKLLEQGKGAVRSYNPENPADMEEMRKEVARRTSGKDGPRKLAANL